MFILSIILSIIKWGFWPWALNNSFSDNHVDLQIFGQLHVLSCLKIIHSKTFEQTVHQFCSMFQCSMFPFHISISIFPALLGLHWDSFFQLQSQTDNHLFPLKQNVVLIIAFNVQCFSLVLERIVKFDRIPNTEYIRIFENTLNTEYWIYSASVLTW